MSWFDSGVPEIANCGLHGHGPWLTWQRRKHAHESLNGHDGAHALHGRDDSVSRSNGVIAEGIFRNTAWCLLSSAFTCTPMPSPPRSVYTYTPQTTVHQSPVASPSQSLNKKTYTTCGGAVIAPLPRAALLACACS